MASDPRDVLTRPAPPPDRVLVYRSGEGAGRDERATSATVERRSGEGAGRDERATSATVERRSGEGAGRDERATSATVEHDGPDHVLDLHLPDGGTPAAPLIVLLHGGFWRDAHDRTHTRPLADALRAEGYAVATPEYRRTPGAGWPQLRADLEAVRAQLPELLAGLGVAARSPYRVLGHSAGGHLALWWALDDPRQVDRVVALAPVADLARAYADDLDGGAVAALLGGGPDDVPDAYADADVAPRLPVAETPIVVLHGDRDRRVPVEHSRGLGIPIRELPGIEHFGPIDPRSPAWPDVRDALR